jgi:uncharacterized protein
VDALIAVPLGGALGFLIGLTGVGGGALVAPALYVLLGVSYGEAVALSLVYSLVTKIVGAVQHVRQRNVRWPVTLVFGALGVPGAIFGSRAVYLASPRVQAALPLVMVGVLLVVGALILLEAVVRALAAREKPFSPDALGPGALAATAGIQLVVGTLLGVTSVGSGSLVIVAMVYLFRMSAREIVGSNIVISLIMVVPAGIAHYLAAGLDWRLLGLLLLGSAVGALLGARATMRVPERVLKLTIAGLVLVAAIATFVKARA